MSRDAVIGNSNVALEEPWTVSGFHGAAFARHKFQLQQLFQEHYLSLRCLHVSLRVGTLRVSLICTN